MISSLSEIEEFLNAVRIPVRLACKTESGWPMIVSLWFLHQGGQLFCATQKSAKVISYLQHDPRCAFEIAADLPPYCGVRGQAIVSIDETKGPFILEQLLIRYLGDLNMSLAKKLLAKSDNEVSIVIKPRTLFTWDFTNRMKDNSSYTDQALDKVCP
jgi:hypothetical protein